MRRPAFSNSGEYRGEPGLPPVHLVTVEPFVVDEDGERDHGLDRRFSLGHRPLLSDAMLARNLPGLPVKRPW